MNIKTTWNLGLMYKSPKDPQIEKDIKAIETACAAFERKYKNSDFIKTPELLAKALNDYEKLRDTTGNKPWQYFALQTDLDSSNSQAGAAATRIEQRINKATNRTTFFTLQIAKIPTKEHKNFLEYPALVPFRYMLQRIFLRAKYNLTEAEEQLEDLLSQTSYTMWVDAQERILSQKTVDYKGDHLPLAKAFSYINELPKKERAVLNKKITDILKAQSPIAEAEINAVYNYKKVMDERRGFAAPTTETAMAHQLDEKALQQLVMTVTKSFPIAHRFYKLHAKLLGEKTIPLHDRNVKIGTIKKKFEFEKSVGIVRDGFVKVDQKYVKIFDGFLKNGQIDVYPKKGKHGGAYCWASGMKDDPTWVFLNHSDDLRSVETLAHEMGHAMHSELSKSQPPRYRRYSTATAEVASTFFEQLIVDELSHHLSDREAMMLLHNKILSDISTVFRQIACYNFELELHQKIRAEGQVNAKVIAELLQKHMKSYVGPAVQVTPDDGYFFVSWSHIRSFFYVSSYAYGQLISKAMYNRWKADPAFSQQVEKFLSAGGSDTPENIFKSIGIDTSKESFWIAGLKSIEEDVIQLEKMAKKLEKKK